MIHNHVLEFIGRQARTNADDVAEPLLNPFFTQQSNGRLTVWHIF